MKHAFRKVLAVALTTACSFAPAAQQGSLVEDKYVIDVASGDVTLNDDDAAALGTGVTLVKKGAGRLVIAMSLASKGWDGELGISNGYVRITANGALGKTTKGTFVADGATLEIDSRTLGNNKLDARSEPITIRGKGVDRGSGSYAGALNNEYAQDYQAFGTVTLAGDALFRSNTRTDIRGYTFNMNGHTLTVQGEIGLTSETFTNPGHIRVESNGSVKGRVYFESGIKMNGSSANTVTFATGSSIVFQGSSYPIEWALVFEGVQTIYCWSGGHDTTKNILNGPISLGSTLNLNFDNKQAVTFNGKISGSGPIATTGKSESYRTVRLNNAENDFTDTLTASATWHIQAASPGALGNSYATKGHVGAVAGFVEAMVGTGNWSDAQLKTFFRNASVGQGGAAVAFLENGTRYDFSDAMTDESAITVGHAGTGSVFNVATAFANTNVTLCNVSGAMTLTGEKTWRLKTIGVNGGDFEISDGAFVASTNLVFIAASWPDVARLVVSNATVQSNPQKGDTKFQIGRSSAYVSGRGLVELKDGASAEIRYDTGFNSTLGMGSILMRSGSYLKNLSTGGGLDGYFANGGGGYHEIAPGSEFKEIGFSIVGNGVGGRAVMSQRGGSYVHTAGDQGIMMSAGGASGSAYSTLHFAGGTASIKPDIHICKCVWNETGRNGRGSVDIDGTADVTVNTYIYIGAHSNAVGTVNLKGGRLTVQQLRMPTNASQFRTGINVPFTDNRSYVNLNGGTLRAGADGALFDDNLTRVTLYGGGASFDVTNRAVTLGHTVEAATGNGIASIPLPPAAATPWAYIGAPYVEINDAGGGTGASAVALFDSENGTITNVVVTSPGCNYTEQTRVTFSRGGWTNSVVVTPVLAANTTGGLTVKGTTGTLTLTSGQIPLGESLALEGGTLEPGVASVTVKSLSGINGTIHANVKVTDELVVDCAKMSPGCQYVIDGTLDLDGVTVRVVNLDETQIRFRLRDFVRATGGITGTWTQAPGCPPYWRVVQRGNTLSFHCERGMAILFR